MIHVHPGNAFVVESSVANRNSLLAELQQLQVSQVLIDLSNLLSFQAHQAFFRENTFLVQTEHRRSLEVTVNRTIPQNFLHHLFFGSGAPASSNQVRLLNFGDWFTLFVLLAALTLCFVQVWRAFFADNMAVLSKEHVEVWPAAITTFVHVVASHKHLRRQHWRLLSVLNLESCFHNLSERDCVTRSAVTLVSKL